MKKAVRRIFPKQGFKVYIFTSFPSKVYIFNVFLLVAKIIHIYCRKYETLRKTEENILNMYNFTTEKAILNILGYTFPDKPTHTHTCLHIHM